MLNTNTPLFYLVAFLILLWISISFVCAIYAYVVRIDAKKDIDVRHDSGINSGRETLAQLVLSMANRNLFAFVIWLFCGLYAISPWSLQQTGPAWRRVIVPAGLVLGQLAIGSSLINFQKKRKLVLDKDKEDETLRRMAEVIVANERTESNTAALDNLTNATNRATEVLTSGNLAAQVAQIDATTDLTAATEELKQATTENTATLEIKTVTIRSELDKE